MSFNSFMRRRGSKSAIQATIAETNASDLNCLNNDFDFETDCQSVGGFADVRILNNPDNSSASAISEESKIVSNVTNNNYEVRSDELAILSTTSSSSSDSTTVAIHNQDRTLLYAFSSNNSQRIDDWCMNSELNGLMVGSLSLHPSTTSSRVQDAVHSWGSDSDGVPLEKYSKQMTTRNNIRRQGNYTSYLLKNLNEEQLSTVKQLTRELLPLLRNSRRTHSVFTNRYRDIPSVFPQRDLILACSLQYTDSDTDILTHSRISEGLSTVCLDDTCSNSSLNSKTWLGWTLVPRLTENDLR